MSDCSAPHPEIDVVCVADANENHPVHYAFPDHQWLNDAYVPPPKEMTREERMTKAKSLTEKVKKAQSGVDKPKVKLRAQPKRTEIEAAEKVSVHSGTQREWILRLLIEQSLTDEEICAALELNPSSGRPRRIELVEMGLVEDSGQRRSTSSGADAVVWKATELGWKVAAAHA